MTATPDQTAARPATCQADLAGEYPTCSRCGLAWHRDAPPPSCSPMNAKALRLVLLSEAAALEGSHHAVVKMRDAGMPADPVDALKRATALRGVLLFVDRCTSNRAIVDILKSEIRERDREAEVEAEGGEHD